MPRRKSSLRSNRRGVVAGTCAKIARHLTMQRDHAGRFAQSDFKLLSAELCHAVASNWIRSTFIRSAGAVTGVLPMPPPSFCARAAEMALSPGRYLSFTIEQWVEAVFPCTGIIVKNPRWSGWKSTPRCWSLGIDIVLYKRMTPPRHARDTRGLSFDKHSVRKLPNGGRL
jgi:hypothetical protein